MRVARAIFLAVLLLGIAVSESAAVRAHPKKGGKKPTPGPRPDYLVQGQSKFEDNRPKDPTPLAPTNRGPYALAHRGSCGERHALP